MSGEANITFRQVWKQMEHEARQQAAETFCTEPAYAREQTRAASLIAMKLKLRPQKAVKLPAERKASYLSSIALQDEFMAGTLLRAHLFTNHKQMLGVFLDELHIAHKDGVIKDESTPAPSEEALRGAVERIRGAFAPADVQMYLSTLLASDPHTWEKLAAVLES